MKVLKVRETVRVHADCQDFQRVDQARRCRTHIGGCDRAVLQSRRKVALLRAADQADDLGYSSTGR